MLAEGMFAHTHFQLPLKELSQVSNKLKIHLLSFQRKTSGVPFQRQGMGARNITNRLLRCRVTAEYSLQFFTAGTLPLVKIESYTQRSERGQRQESAIIQSEVED